jgi:hypothetical protein
MHVRLLVELKLNLHYRFTTFELLVLLVRLGASSKGCHDVHLRGCLIRPIRVREEETASCRFSFGTSISSLQC